MTDRYAKKLATMFDFARALAKLSTCKRACEGAIIFSGDCSRVYAIGYNGPPRGQENDACTGAEGACGCVHAEANAIVKANLSPSTPALMYCTRAPCAACAGLIVNSRVVYAVIYGQEYRDSTGIWRLAAAGVLTALAEEVLKDVSVLKRWSSCAKDR